MIKKIGNPSKYISAANIVGAQNADPVRNLYKNLWRKNALTSINDPQNVVRYNFDPSTIRKNDNFKISNDNKIVYVGVPQSIPTNNFLGIDFFDFHFTINSPFVINPKEEKSFANTSLTTTIEKQTKINYPNSDYETFTENNSEYYALNYYIAAAKDVRPDEKNNDIEAIVTNDNRIDDFLLDGSLFSQYFNQYALTFADWEQKFEKLYLETLKKLFFSSEIFNVGRKYFSVFPKLNVINFYKQPSAEYFSAVKDTFLNLNLFSNTILSEKKPSAEKFVVQHSQTKFDLNQQIDYINYKTFEEVKDIFAFDFDKWLNDLLTKVGDPNNNARYFEFSNSQTNRDVLYVGSTRNEDLPSYRDNAFLASLMSIVLKGKINALNQTYTRSVEDMLNGKECHTEPLLVKIIKTKVESPAKYTQTYYFENNSSDLLEFIDSQIKKDTEYQYRFFYYVLAIGNKYRYSTSGATGAVRTGQFSQTIAQDNNPKNVEKTNMDDELLSSSGLVPVNLQTSPKTFYSITSEPCLKIFETELLVEPATSGLSSIPETITPPSTPGVFPIQYKDLKNKIKFVMKRNYDSYKEEPIILLDSDIGMFDPFLQDSKKVLFSSLEPAVTTKTFLEDVKISYEMFRIEKEPSSYRDFYNQLKMSFAADTFVDTLEYNTKYYYIFREVIEYGTTKLKSNPTGVLEIEIINNSGVYYPIIKPFEFKVGSGASKSKSLKKYLYLQASYPQTVPNFGNPPNLRNVRPIDIGLSETAWDKNYKIRLTSKQSGRKIDINFKLTYTSKEDQRIKIEKINKK